MENKNCGTCLYYGYSLMGDCEVCNNEDSEQYGYDTEEDYVCKFWECRD